MVKTNIKEEGKENLDIFFKISPDFLCIADLKGIFKKVNPTFTKILGYKPEEILNKPFTHFVHSEDVKTTIENINEMAKGKKDINFKNRYKKKDGDYVSLLWNASQVENKIYATGIKHIENQVKETNSTPKNKDLEIRKLTEINELKTQFIAVASHELRTPLTPIKTELDLIMKEYYGKLSETQKKSMEMIIRNVNSLNELIRDLLDVSRLDRKTLIFKFRKVNLNTIVEDTLTQMKYYMPKKHINITSNKIPIKEIELDPDRFAQVLKNFLTNAVKFSKKEGKVSVRLTKEGKFIKVEVKDAGMGIAKENMKRLFIPFSQLEDGLYTRETSGTGLGLAISKGIAEAQGGEIGVRSTLGKGSTFFFTVPLTPVKPKEAPKSKE